VARTVRFELPDADNKTFRQCRPDGDGWKWSIKDIEIPLYRLPEVLHAPASETIYLVEGERKADALRAWGLTATCNCMGSGKFRPHHAKTLAGRSVVILPDNDAAGREHERKAFQELRLVGARVCTVELPGLPEKGDIIDWIAAGHTKAELLALVNAASMKPTPEPDAADQDGFWEDPLLSTEAVGPRDWIVRPYLLRSCITCLFGMTSLGKSTVALTWACLLALKPSKLPIHGWGKFKSPGGLRVLLYGLEEDRSEQRRRTGRTQSEGHRRAGQHLGLARRWRDRGRDPVWLHGLRYVGGRRQKPRQAERGSWMVLPSGQGKGELQRPGAWRRMV